VHGEGQAGRINAAPCSVVQVTPVAAKKKHHGKQIEKVGLNKFYK
jgi:hypothetical protein